MTKDLYFLRIIVGTLQQSDSKAAIERAFKIISELGRQPAYGQGFRQFKQFMKVMKDYLEGDSNKSDSITHPVLNDLIFQISTGVIEGNQDEIADFIGSHPEWRQKFVQMHQDLSTPDAWYPQLKVIIERNGENICSIPVEDGAFFKKIKNLKPGFYHVKLNTGRVLWQAELTDRDLVWTAAYPERDMAMAAETGDCVNHVTREIRLLAGDLTIRIIPELESGCVELEIRN